jgi:hypothetical protein
MPELHDILAAEAERRQPTRPPAFDTLVRARRQRYRRHNFVGVFLVAVAVGGVATGVTLRGAGGVERQRPGGPGPASTTVAVTGQLLRIGGPPGVPAEGVPGTVVIEAADGQRITIRTGDDGHFSTTLAPGRYTVTGTSPQINDGHGTCGTDRPVVVAAGHPTDIVVACHIR